MAINLYRRHTSKCSIDNWSILNKCKCPLIADGRLDNGAMVNRRSLRTSSKSAADAIVRAWQERGSTEAAPESRRTDRDRREREAAQGTLVAPAIEQFLEYEERNKRASAGTLGIYRTAFLRSTTTRRPNAKRMLTLEAYCAARGIRWIDEVTATDLEALQADWFTEGFEQSTINQKMIHLKTLWSFLGYRGIAKLDLREFKPAKLAIDATTKPFTRDEMRAIIATASHPMDRALILFLRYSGLRILDAITCPIANLYEGSKLVLRQRKVRHGRSSIISLELPVEVSAALRQFKPRSDEFWFWDGRQSEKSIRQHWYKRLKTLFSKAGATHGHPHMLRHTFAVENLLAGMSVKNVSEALGHSTVVTTERHYLHWVKLRQLQLDQELRAVHASDELLQSLSENGYKTGTKRVRMMPSKRLSV